MFRFDGDKMKLLMIWGVPSEFYDRLTTLTKKK